MELSILEMVTVTRLLSKSSVSVPMVRGDVTRTKEPDPLRVPAQLAPVVVEQPSECPSGMAEEAVGVQVLVREEEERRPH